MPHLLCQHPQLLEIDETLDLRLVAQVGERQVLVHHGVDGDERGLMEHTS